MQNPRPELADLIGSRICHDLISPLGAISNGLELLGMNPAAQGPELDLITQSIENANARIRFFRIAYGAASPGQMVSARELSQVLAGMREGSRVVIEWDDLADANRQVVKLVFLLLQVFETAMPRGGHVRVSELGGEWSVHGTSEHLAIDPELWHRLSCPPGSATVEPARVQFALAPQAAAAIGRVLTVDSADTSARIRF